MNPKELGRLIDELIEQTISEADFLRLEAEMIVDPEARKVYLDRVALSQALAVEAHMLGESAATPTRQTQGQKRWFTSRPTLIMAVAAVLIVLVTAVALFQEPSSNNPSEAKASGFAVLANQVGAVWTNPTLQNGDLIPSGPLSLTSGIAQIEMFSGVMLVLEGGAKFEIVSPMEVRLTAGKLRAQVPEAAHGFRVRTQGGDVVDLGTEFALDVSGKKSELHVLDGEVEWHPPEGEMKLMKKGEAMLNEDGFPTRKIIANATAFTGVSELLQRESEALRRRQQAWQEEVDRLVKDPRTLAFYSMAAPEARRRLPNLTVGKNKPGTAAVVAAMGTEDRWGRAQGALDFSPTGSRVRLHVSGTYGSLTMMCWVKLNSLDRLYNSLFLTDGHDVGAPHWQITHDGRLFFSVKKSNQGQKDKRNFFSPPFWDASVAGQWLMLAVVYDVSEKKVTHFLNGKAIATETIPEDFLVQDVRIGNASIGNWSEPVYRTDPAFTVRNLNGSMDEFALFSAPLSEKEIGDMYQKGRP